MYSKKEASQLKQEFWTYFGQYMSPVPSAEGEKINWINYRTGEKGISFRMHANNRKAVIEIELSHKDPGIQQLYYQQLQQFENLLHETLGERWEWQLHAFDEYGKQVSRIFKEQPGVSIFSKEDWPALISFFKPRITALDQFWSNVKYAFEMLR